MQYFRLYTLTVPNVVEDLDNSRTAQLEYSLLSEEGKFDEPRPGEPAKKRFAVDPDSGDILVSRQVEALTTYVLNISAQDEGGLSTITQIILRINDTNNNRLGSVIRHHFSYFYIFRPVFDKSYYNFKVLEGDYNGANIGLIHSEDGDFFENGRVTYRIVTDDQSIPFLIDSVTGAMTISGTLDRENIDSFKFSVMATDHGTKALESVVNVTVTVLDENDAQPVFYGYNRLLEQNGLHMVPVFSSHINSFRVDAGVMVAEVYANDTDDVLSGNGVVEFRILDHSNIFYIHPDSGEVTTLVPIGKKRNKCIG